MTSAAEERASIVAWMLAETNRCFALALASSSDDSRRSRALERALTYAVAIDAIERGAHLHAETVQ